MQKAGVDELLNDDRTVIYGALLALADQLRGEGADQLVELWRRRGRRAFEREGSRLNEGRPDIEFRSE